MFMHMIFIIPLLLIILCCGLDVEQSEIVLEGNGKELTVIKGGNLTSSTLHLDIDVAICYTDVLVGVFIITSGKNFI